MKQELQVWDAEQFLENRNTYPVTIATMPYEDGEVVDTDHPDWGQGEFYGESAAKYLNQMDQEPEEANSQNQFVGSLLNPHTAEITDTPELSVHNSDGDLSYSIEFDVESQGDEYKVAMHGHEEDYADPGPGAEFQQGLEEEFEEYVEDSNPKLRQALQEEFMDELMQD